MISRGVKAHLGLLLAFILMLGSCAQFERGPGSKASSETTIHIFHTFAQHLALEACGCSFRSLGGMARLQVAMNRSRKNVTEKAESLFLASGPSFSYWGIDGKGKTLPDQKKEIESLIDTWSALKLDVLSVSTEDLSLGMDQLKQLEARSKFRWVSANIIQKITKASLFSPSMAFEKDGHQVLVTGIASKGERLPEAITIDEPVAALERTVKAAVPKPDVVIILASYVSDEERAAIQRAIAIPHVILFGNDSDSLNGAAGQYSFSSIHMRSLNRGRSISQLSIFLKPGMKEFFNPEIAFQAMSSQDPIQKNIQQLEKDLGRTKSKSEQAKILKTLAERRDALGRAQLMPIHPTSGSSIFEYAVFPLDQQFDPVKKGQAE